MTNVQEFFQSELPENRSKQLNEALARIIAQEQSTQDCHIQYCPQSNP